MYNEGKEDYSVVFAQLTKRDGSFLVGREPMPDFKWDDVRGKMIIGGRKGGVPEMTLEYVLKQNNIIPGQDVEIDTSIQFALMGGAFLSGQGDFVTLFEPVASSFEREKTGYIVCSIGQESGEIPYTAYYAKKAILKRIPILFNHLQMRYTKGNSGLKTTVTEKLQKHCRNRSLNLI